MITTDFSISGTVKSSPDQAYKAITENIPGWWSRYFEGAAVESGQIFTVVFDAHQNTSKKIRIGQLIPGSLVEWECIDANLNIDTLSNKKEWIGTKMSWSIQPDGEGAKLTLTHEGLTPEMECFGICEAGWHQFFGSLVKLLNTGKGDPA